MLRFVTSSSSYDNDNDNDEDEDMAKVRFEKNADVITIQTKLGQIFIFSFVN